MTAPDLPAVIPGITRSHWHGEPWPADAARSLLNLLVTGAPFAASLTRYPTNRRAVAFLTAAPTGWAWTPELGRIPEIDMNDETNIVATAKLAGLLPLSNEAVADSAINLTSMIRSLLTDGLSRDLDQGLLDGQGEAANEPVGVVRFAPPVAGANLLTAVAAAKGAIADAGGAPTTLAMSGTAMAAADTATAEGGALLYPGGFAAALGLTGVTVPGLTSPLVYDKSRVFFVVRSDPQVSASSDYLFGYDAVALRIIARAAVACPDPNRAIRRLDIAGSTLTVTATAATDEASATPTKRSK